MVGNEEYDRNRKTQLHRNEWFVWGICVAVFELVE